MLFRSVLGTSLDKGVELDALKAMDPAERTALIDRAVAGEQVTARRLEVAKNEVRLFAAHLEKAVSSMVSSFGCRSVALLVSKIERMAAKAAPEDLAALDDALAQLAPLAGIRRGGSEDGPDVYLSGNKQNV